MAQNAAVINNAPAPKKGIIECFMEGVYKGLQIGMKNIIPAMVLGYIIIYIFTTTGLLNIMGDYLGGVMNIWGLPGEAFAVLISAFFAKASGCTAAYALYTAHKLSLGQTLMLWPASILMGTLVGHYARIVLVAGASKKWHWLLICVPLFDAAICMWIMRIVCAKWM